MYLPRENIRNEEIFNTFAKKRNISKKTQDTYLTTFGKYCKLHNMTLQELHDEADQEEEQGIRQKNSNIINRIENYREYLLDNNYSTNTIK